MKKFLLIQTALFALTIVIGIMCRSTFTNSGLSDIKTANDALKLTCYIQGGNYSEESIQDYYDIEAQVKNSDNASTILVVKSTDNITQHFWIMAQRVVVKDVIRGDANLTGSMIDIYSRGFANSVDFGQGPTYYGQNNLMFAENEYLVFLGPMKGAKYLEIPSYEFAESSLPCLNLSKDTNSYLTVTDKMITFGDVKDVEFFTASQKMLAQINLIKDEIIARYPPS